MREMSVTLLSTTKKTKREKIDGIDSRVYSYENLVKKNADIRKKIVRYHNVSERTVFTRDGRIIIPMVECRMPLLLNLMRIKAGI